MPVFEIISNISLLIAISVISGFIDKRWERTTLNGKLLQGALFSVTVVTGMLYPFVYAPGIIFDGRSIVISICTLFFGPAAGIMTAATAGITRILIGGGGTTIGLFVIFSSFLAGFFFQRNQNRFKINPKNLYLMGAVVHIVMMLLMFLLPGREIIETAKTLGIPILLIYPLLTVLMGKIMLDQEENFRYVKMLSENAERFRTTLYSIADAVITTDKDELVTHLNPAAEILLGVKESEVTGKPVSKILKLCHANGENLSDMEFKALIHGGSHHEFAMEYFLKTGESELIAISESISPIINSDGTHYGTIIVIRDQRKNREALKRLKLSEQKLSGYIQNAPFGIFAADKSGQFISANPAGCKTLEYSESEITKLKTSDIIFSEDSEKAMRHFESVLAEGFAYDELRFLTRSGKIGEFGVTAFMLSDGTLIGYTDDLTARKKAEREMETAIENLKKYAEELRRAQKVAKVGSWVWHVDADEIEWSDEMYNIFGIKKENFHGNLAEVIAASVHPDDRNAFEQSNRKVITQNKPEPLEYRIIDVNGKVKYVYAETDLLTLDESSGKRKLIGIVQDITERKISEKIKDDALQALSKSESEYRLLIENQTDLIIKVDPEGRFLFVSQSYCKMFGKTEEELIGKEFMPLVHPEDSEITMKSYKKIFESPYRVYFEQRVMTNEGWRWIGWLDTAILNESGEIIEIIGVGRDIQEQKKTEIELQEKISELEKFNSFTVERELRMIELKKEINDLLVKCGKKEKYKIN